jgi:preprotein translocase subunit SecD
MIHISRLQVAAIIGFCLLAILIALPNAFPASTMARLPAWLPSRQVSLGLDLQGGSHLLYQLDLESLIQERMATTGDSIRTELAKAKVSVSDFAQDGAKFSFRLANPADEKQARDAIGYADADIEVSVGADGLLTATKPPQSIQKIRDNAIRQTIEIIRRRVDETGTREPTITQEGANRVLIQLPGVRDSQSIKDVIGTTAKLSFRLVDQDAPPGATHAPPGDDLLPLDRSEAGGLAPKMAIRKRVMVGGDNLVDAQPATDQNGQWVIDFKFDSIGARRFGDATTQNVGKPFAIVLDNKVLSAPIIREAITGGRGQISGSFTADSATKLALLLRAGALPAPLTVIEERSVGPGLGADSIRAGGVASGLGFLLVAGFMILVYGRFGIMADVALVANLIFIIACMTLLQATLTLPGIAGIVLTMGMSVDANVLIFERIREEQKLGRSVISAIDTGYQRAFVTIIDSNLTTLIATVFLYFFGTGPVRGFAVTLIIGIVGSIFTSVMLTRLMMVGWMRRTKPQSVLV